MKINIKDSQNFLCNVNLVNNIVNTSNISKDDIIIEIGPGKGIITEVLSIKAKEVIAIEYDSNFANELKKKTWKNVSIINTNFNANRFSTPFRDYNTTYDYDVERYYEQIEDIFDFEETEYDNFYRFSFVQKSINPSEIVLFPAIIFVKKDIQSIKFSITGRYTKKIITGFLSIK